MFSADTKPCARSRGTLLETSFFGILLTKYGSIFGESIGLVAMSIINNFQYWPDLGIKMILVTSPFWIMGILSLLTFKKDRFENMEKNVVILLIILMFSLLVQWFYFPA
jgi:uncharacterized membrane protein AbrB (regulator of aidB expression)